MLIDEVDVLPRLFRQVLIPREVFLELTHEAAPSAVREWAERPPNWLEARAVDIRSSDPIPDLDPGEEAAIRLAQQRQAVTFLLTDDAKGRRVATRYGIRTTGTLGVLRAASRAGLLLLRDVLPHLLQNYRTTYRFIAGTLLYLDAAFDRYKTPVPQK